MFIHFFIDFEKDDNLIFILSISKINFFHKEIHISFIIIINKSSIYLIIILCIFFNYFLIDFIISLFIRIFDAFSQGYCIKIIKNIFLDINFNSINFFNHFLQKETIIFIIIISISHDNIKILRK